MPLFEVDLTLSATVLVEAATAEAAEEEAASLDDICLDFESSRLCTAYLVTENQRRTIDRRGGVMVGGAWIDAAEYEEPVCEW